MKTPMILTFMASLVLLIGCGKPAENVQTESAPIPPIFVSEIMDGSPLPIPEARNLKPGETVLLTGLIMGVPQPFVEKRAAFVLGDEQTITPCDAMAEDHCAKPWDACCDPAQIRMEGTVTIQVVDENGKLIRTGLKGTYGLSELSRVTVAGTVAPNSSAASFIVNADSIHIGVR